MKMKKIACLFLSLAMLLGMTVGASAAIPNDAIIVGVDAPISYHNDPYLENIKLSDLGSSRTIDFPITADMFSWDFDGGDSYGAAVTRSHIARSGVKLQTHNLTPETSSVIESANLVYKSTHASGNKPTAVVQVKFRDRISGSSKKNFGIEMYFTINGSTAYSYYYTLSGSISPDGGTDIGNGDYIDISDGTVLQPSKTVRNVSLYLGDGVTVKTHLSANRRYSGTASNEISRSDDSLIRRYPSIEEIIVIRQTNLNAGTSHVILDVGSGYHVYNDEQKYVGRSSAVLPFSTKYYLSSKKIDMGGGEPESIKPTPAPSSSVVEKDDAVAKTQSALKTNKAASVKYQDMTYVPATTLQAMNAAAKKAGGTVSLVADTMNGNSVQGRITIPTANASKITGDVYLGVSVNNEHTRYIKSLFNGWYTNNIAVVSLTEDEGFDVTVSVAAKVNLPSAFRASDLHLYIYDQHTGKYQLISGANAKTDDKGYIYFNVQTTTGGDIIISDGPLKSR